jgi:hypothetical protein
MHQLIHLDVDVGQSTNVEVLGDSAVLAILSPTLGIKSID